MDDSLDADAVLENILDAETRGELYPLYARLRELAPAHRSTSARLPLGCWVLTSFRNVDRVARSAGAVNDPATAKVFDQDGTGNGAFYRLMRDAMLFLEKPAHDRVRKLVYKAFTPRAVAPTRELTEQIAHELIDRVAAARSMDFVRDFAYPIPIVVIARLLGLPDDAEPRIEEWAWDFARAGDPMSATPDIVERGNCAAEGFTDFFDDALRQRRAHPADDIMTTLVHAEDGGETLSHHEAIATSVLLLQAGHETTADLLGNGMIALLRNPDELRRLRNDQSLLPSAVEELLRFDPSVQMSMRFIRESVEVDGATLPAGSMAALVYGAANRDPAVFDDPDVLRLDRGPVHLAFSAGAYYCLGNALARTEIQAALRVLLDRLPTIRAGADTFVQRRTMRLRGPQQLRVAWD
ncbi:MAG TPA: cytochrome P450 [Acidimicrobiales bacterium]|nr:cytochrome P450 [Acidimicrobiales bacterium]